jgi:TonB family protein
VRARRRASRSVASRGGAPRARRTAGARAAQIDVNAIAPGALNTRLLDEVLAGGPARVGQAFYERSVRQKQEGGAPMERGARLAVFLGSAASDGITAKLLSALWDSWEGLPDHLDDLRSTDVYTLRRIVADAGFGGTGVIARSPEPARAAQVQASGFGSVEVTPPSRRPAAAAARVETPVEVTAKPKPEYTDEARSRKVEGEVWLDVEFRASGEIRVLRVVRGLGYGLDEAASRAAERIQFKPARTASGPIDVRATVQIIFRLT